MSGASTSRDEQEALAHRLMEEVWSKGDLSVTHEIVAANFTNHDPSTPDGGSGPDAYNEVVRLYRKAFPDAKFTIDETIAAGDKVVIRYTCRGTHEGELMGIRPERKKIAVTGTLVFRMGNGKIEEAWVNWDTLGLMRQLGVGLAL